MKKQAKQRWFLKFINCAMCKREAKKMSCNCKNAQDCFVNRCAYGKTCLDKPYEFCEGDIAEFGGIEGRVTVDESPPYPIRWYENEGSCTDRFTRDGRLRSYHTKPLLKLIRKAKRKVTREVRQYANVYKNGSITVWPDRNSAESVVGDRSGLHAIAVPIFGTYEEIIDGD